MNSHYPEDPGQATGKRPGGAQARNSLLTAVDFKWLMAGQGWWIDTTRLHCDKSYAAGLLRLALGSQSSALRECAMVLQTQISGLAPLA